MAKTIITNLDTIVQQSVDNSVAVAETLQAKQDVINAINDAQAIVDSVADAVSVGKLELNVYTTIKENELDAKTITEKAELDAHCVVKINEYNDNHTTKLAAYNANDATKIAQYNANHEARLIDMETEYSQRIVDILNTGRILGATFSFIPSVSTYQAKFLSTNGTYVYLLNGVILPESAYQVELDGTTITLSTQMTPKDVLIQIDTELMQYILENSLDVLTSENLNQPNGICGLDENGLVSPAQLPSYVDDVLEFPTYADLPVEGETGKIYIVIADETSSGDTSSYRWTGTVYAMVSNTLTAADVKVLYESNADTNAYTDVEKTLVDVGTALNTETTTLPQAINEVHGELDTHTGSTAAHGVTEVVGTVEAQTITNKYIDDMSNWIGANHVHYKVKATENLVGGDIVMGVGYNSGEDAFEVAKWTVASGKPALGMVHTTITKGGFGLISQHGMVNNINTNSLTEGLIYYPADNGLLTATKPTSGYYQACVYVVRSHNSQGAVTVNFSEPLPVNWDDRYYTEDEINTLLTAQNEASEITTTLNGNVSNSTVQLMLEKILNGTDPVEV